MTQTAIPEMRTDTNDAGNQFLTVTLGREVFGIDILHIREILEHHELTPVPMMPAAISGVINLRGSVVPVVDLSVRFGRPPSTIGKRTSIVIIEMEVEDEMMEVGVIVDAVNEVLEIDDLHIEPTPQFGVQIRSDFIRGMGRVDDKFIVLLDVQYVLSVAELSALTQEEIEGAGSDQSILEVR